MQINISIGYRILKTKYGAFFNIVDIKVLRVNSWEKSGILKVIIRWKLEKMIHTYHFGEDFLVIFLDKDK